MSEKRKKPRLRLAAMIPHLVDSLDKMDDETLAKLPTINKAVQKYRKEKKAAEKNGEHSKIVDNKSKKSEPLHSKIKIQRLSTSSSRQNVPASNFIKIKRLHSTKRTKKQSTCPLSTEMEGAALPENSETANEDNTQLENDRYENDDTLQPFEFEEQDHSIDSDVSPIISDDHSFNVITDIQHHKCYEIEIRKYKKIATLDDCFSRVVIPDFNIKKNCLMDNAYVVIKRRTLIDHDEQFKWMYSCHCDPFKMSLIETLDSGSKLPTDSDLDFNTCIHIKAARNIIEELSCSNNIHPEADVPLHFENEITELPYNPMHLAVTYENVVGIVGFKQSRLQCFLCNSLFCEHVSYIRSARSDIGENNILKDFFDTELQPSKKSNVTVNCVSVKKISFTPNQREQYCLRTPVENYLNSVDGFLQCIDNELVNCALCGDELLLETFQIKRLYLTNNVFKCQVYSKKCSNTDCALVCEYDGANDCVLHMDKLLIHHSVMRDYMLHFLHGNSCTLTSFYDILGLKLSDCGFTDFKTHISPSVWRQSWYAFLSLLDHNLSEASCCSLCGTIPETVICDATSLGYQRKFATVAMHDADGNTICFPRYSTHSTRIAIPSRNIRDQFRLLIEKKMNNTMKSNFFNNLRACNIAIYNVVKWVYDVYKNDIPKAFTQFFQCLASSSPVCSYIVPAEFTCTLVLRLCDDGVKSDVELLRAVQREAPILYHLLSTLTIETCLPDIFKGLLIYLCDLTMIPFKEAAEANTGLAQSNLTELSRFPNMPKMRNRGFYQQDKELFKNPCRKTYAGHPRLLPGIFTVYCQHGICYGYQVMENPESPNVPFTIFKTRFPKAPSTIIYDNACGLHAFCLNRDPVYFQKSLFVVDRFHWKNHTGCSMGYNINLYPHLKDVNSEINEQQNASTKKLKTQLSYMKPENFIKHCDFYIWYRNILKKAKLDKL